MNTDSETTIHTMHTHDEFMRMRARAERAEAELAALREQTRWRKYPNEFPANPDVYLVQTRLFKASGAFRASWDGSIWNEIEDSDYAGEEFTDIICWAFIPEPPDDTADDQAII